MPPKKPTSTPRPIKAAKAVQKVEETLLANPTPAPAAALVRTESKGSGTAIKAPAAPKTITHDMISKRAHELWIAGGCRDGNSAADWAEAERQLKAGL